MTPHPNPIVQAQLDQIEREAPEMKSAWAELEIEWHCPGRHGVVRGIPAAKAGYVNRVIEWHMGSAAARWTGTTNGTRDAEFVAMTKVYPPPRKPWEWCGETVLFGDWQRREQETKEAAAQFEPLETVWFHHKNQRFEGQVLRVNAKTVSVQIPGERGHWTIPPTELHKGKAYAD
jgi:hypothetical protein